MMSVSYVVSSSLPMFVCLFWTLNFLGQYVKSPLNKRVLFWFMLTSTLLYFGHFVVFNHLYSLIPLTDTIYTFATGSVYPIYLLYIISLTGRLRLRHLFILVPGLVLVFMVGLSYVFVPDAFMTDLLQACHYEMGTYPEHWSSQLSQVAHHALKWLILLEVALVLPLGILRLRDFRVKVAECFSTMEHRDLKEIKYLLVAFVVTSCFSVIADLIGRAYFVGSMGLLLIALVPFSVMLFLLGFIGNHQKFSIEDLLLEEAKDAPLSEDDSQFLLRSDARRELREKIDALMQEERLYLRADLKLSDLATRLNTNRTYIYDALKGDDENSLSFPDYVNHFRIAYAQKQMNLRPKADIGDIVYEAGFASKATFYKNFRKFVGCSPLQYMKKKK